MLVKILVLTFCIIPQIFGVLNIDTQVIRKPVTNDLAEIEVKSGEAELDFEKRNFDEMSTLGPSVRCSTDAEEMTMEGSCRIGAGPLNMPERIYTFGEGKLVFEVNVFHRQTATAIPLNVAKELEQQRQDLIEDSLTQLIVYLTITKILRFHMDIEVMPNV